MRALFPFCCPLLAFVFLSLPTNGQSGTIGVTIDTSALAGQAGQLAFDFIDGGLPSNSVTLSGVAMSGGAFGVPLFTGGASAGGPATFLLIDSSFFNEVLLPITIGTQITFSINSTDLGPLASSIPDSFTIFLLDSSGLPLVSTADPTGGNALLQIDAGTNSVNVFSPMLTAAIPEPSTQMLVLFSGGLLTCLFRRFRRI